MAQVQTEGEKEQESLACGYMRFSSWHPHPLSLCTAGDREHSKGMQQLAQTLSFLSQVCQTLWLLLLFVIVKVLNLNAGYDPTIILNMLCQRKLVGRSSNLVCRGRMNSPFPSLSSLPLTMSPSSIFTSLSALAEFCKNVLPYTVGNAVDFDG